MGKAVDGAIQSLIQGVSQQAPVDRIPGQAELQENMSNDPERGLLRRPPTTFVDHMFVDAEDYQFYNMEIDGVVYILASKPGTVRAFTLDGVEKTVNIDTSALPYITDAPLSFITLDGITYVSNPDVEVQMLDDVQDYVQNSGIVFMLGGQYGRTYTITVKANDVTYTGTWDTPDGSSSAHGALISTNNIISELDTALNASTGFTDVMETTVKSDVMLITWKSGVTEYKMDITVEDGDGGANIFAVTNKAGDVGRLPRFAPEGYVVTVTGLANDYADDWYLQFTQEEPGFGNEGLWVECVGPDVKYKFDLATMPHKIILEDNGTFTMSQGDWLDRRVGDEYSNPDPSCVGSTINDLSSFQGRLVLLSGENVIMSRTSEHNELWVSSATGLIDADPIDISSSATRSTPVMRRAIPHNRDLVIFSDTAQFIVFGRNAITPENTSLVLTTSYEAELNAEPVPSGKNVFYAINYGSFTGIKEFFTEGDADVNASRPITSHCTQYLEGKIQAMTTSTNFELLLCQTDTSVRRLYAYEYLWINNEKVQSAWSTWVFPWDILHTFFVENVVYFIRKIGNTVSIDKMSMDRVPDNGYYQTHLDSRVYVDGVNTIMAKPYTADDIMYVQGEGCPNPGLLAKVQSETDTEVVFHRDMSGGTIIMGRYYESRCIPTRPFITDSKERPVSTGTLMIQLFKISHKDTGDYHVTTVSKWHDDVDTRFSGRVLNSVDNLVGVPAVDTGHFIVPFMHEADSAYIDIKTTSQMPLRLLQIEWKGNYVKYGTRIS